LKVSKIGTIKSHYRRGDDRSENLFV